MTKLGLRYGDDRMTFKEPCVNVQEDGEPCGHFAIEHYEEHAAAMFNNLPCGVNDCSCDNFFTKDDDL